MHQRSRETVQIDFSILVHIGGNLGHGLISLKGGSLFSCRLVPFSPAEVVPFSIAVSSDPAV